MARTALEVLKAATGSTRDFYVAPGKRGVAIALFAMVVITAVMIVVSYYHKGTNKLFWRNGAIGRQFHGVNAKKAIATAVLGVGVGSLLVIYTVVAGIFHLVRKKSEDKKDDSFCEAPGSLPPDWEECVNEAGVPFYFNQKTGESQWDRPKAADDADFLTWYAKRTSGNEVYRFSDNQCPINSTRIELSGLVTSQDIDMLAMMEKLEEIVFNRANVDWLSFGSLLGEFKKITMRAMDLTELDRSFLLGCKIKHLSFEGGDNYVDNVNVRILFHRPDSEYLFLSLVNREMEELTFSFSTEFHGDDIRTKNLSRFLNNLAEDAKDYKLRKVTYHGKEIPRLPLSPLPAGWCKVPNDGSPYYWNEELQESRWDRPV